VNSAAALAGLEDITGRARVASRAGALLPVGVRRRQLPVRTLLLGMALALADHRPAHLTRVHGALTSLPAGDQARLGVIARWKNGPHLLTYRQTERTFGLAARAPEKDTPDGAPAQLLTRLCDDLLEASIPDARKDTTRALAADWSDQETFSRPPSRGSRHCAGPEASRGHRKGGGPGQHSELFFGFYLSAATMAAGEHGPAVPELARRMTLTSCHPGPARALVPVLARLPAHGVPLGDVLADSGYAHRTAEGWAIPLRAAGATLTRDLHPDDRGPHGTHAGAIISNGSLYCPATLRPLLELGPLARDATAGQIAAHDQQTAETASRRTASSGKSPLRTLTATTGSCAPPPRGNSAARSARNPWPRAGSGPRSSPRPVISRPAAPSRPSPCRPAWQPKPRRNTTTPPGHTAAPAHGAPPPSAPSPPPKIQPATTSPAAGAASWA
jgi:hypothetical protein